MECSLSLSLFFSLSVRFIEVLLFECQGWLANIFSFSGMLGERNKGHEKGYYWKSEKVILCKDSFEFTLQKFTFLISAVVSKHHTHTSLSLSLPPPLSFSFLFSLSLPLSLIVSCLLFSLSQTNYFDFLSHRSDLFSICPYQLEILPPGLRHGVFNTPCSAALKLRLRSTGGRHGGNRLCATRMFTHMAATLCYTT